MAKKIVVDIVSDTICPWCFIGKRRLEKAMGAAGSKFEFEVRWHPFQLDPQMPKTPANKLQRLKSKFGEERINMMLPHMLQVGASDGIRFNFDGDVANTIDSHRLIELADRKGGVALQNKVAEELFKLYFEQAKNIGDINALAEAAASAGMSKTEVIEYLNSNAGEAETKEQIRSWQQKNGITGVPHYFINGKISIGGAQDPAVFLQAFEKA